MNKIKAFFMAIAAFFVAVWKKICKIISDISTFLREGGTDSAFSSKRICAVGLICVGIKLLFVGASAFVQIMDKGWYSVLVFVPSALCFTFATIYFYINGKIDITDVSTKAAALIEAAKK